MSYSGTLEPMLTACSADGIPLPTVPSRILNKKHPCESPFKPNSINAITALRTSIYVAEYQVRSYRDHIIKLDEQIAVLKNQVAQGRVSSRTATEEFEAVKQLLENATHREKELLDEIRYLKGANINPEEDINLRNLAGHIEFKDKYDCQQEIKENQPLIRNQRNTDAGGEVWDVIQRKEPSGGLEWFNAEAQNRNEDLEEENRVLEPGKMAAAPPACYNEANGKLAQNLRSSRESQIAGQKQLQPDQGNKSKKKKGPSVVHYINYSDEVEDAPASPKPTPRKTDLSKEEEIDDLFEVYTVTGPEYW
ncbi:hypothetical protein ABW20_dc0106519 [Dactylellina cionopaga]|nr:hypothetical protein ABW20_dc0106519 [Dactylellina cionopaga]